MAVVATLLMTILLPSTASPVPPAHLVARALVFETPLAKFISVANSEDRDKRLTWEYDGCSAPVIGSTGRSFDFVDACRRHDFAYRNLGKLDGGKWWTAQIRAQVDSIFKQDMLANCAARSIFSRTTCRIWAETFYRAVRTYAGP